MSEHTPEPLQPQDEWTYSPTHWAGGWGEHCIVPNRIRIQSPECGTVAYIEHHGGGHGQQNIYPTPEDYQRARRIAAAPELLAACKDLVSPLGLAQEGHRRRCPFCKQVAIGIVDFPDADTCPVVVARAVIAKAERKA